MVHAKRTNAKSTSIHCTGVLTDAKIKEVEDRKVTTTDPFRMFVLRDDRRAIGATPSSAAGTASGVAAGLGTSAGSSAAAAAVATAASTVKSLISFATDNMTNYLIQFAPDTRSWKAIARLTESREFVPL
jgi:hypothetical protein